MSRQTIQDDRFRTLGYIETMPDGKQKALDPRFRTLGYYDPKRNVTQDERFRTIANGNVLSGLIYNQR
jgi:hypothetical protein